MNDKVIMENILLTTKGVCDLYMHGTIESAGTQDVNHAFDNALDQSLCMQKEIFSKMAAKGWYPSQQVEQQKKDQLRQKFAGQ